jgi:hypothetical protein
MTQRKVWEVKARQGQGPWKRYLFASRARALEAIAAYLKDGNEIMGPDPRNVY